MIKNNTKLLLLSSSHLKPPRSTPLFSRLSEVGYVCLTAVKTKAALTASANKGGKTFKEVKGENE